MAHSELNSRWMKQWNVESYEKRKERRKERKEGKGRNWLKINLKSDWERQT